MPIGIVSQSFPRPKPAAVSAKRTPVAIEKPAGLSSSSCSDQPADDPEDRRRLLVGLALGKAAAPGRDRGADREHAEAAAIA